jgi:RNA-directed DNA polymerase
MPGNAGGAKDPDFWCAFEAGKVTVIGSMSLQTPTMIRVLQRELCREAKKESTPCR